MALSTASTWPWFREPFSTISNVSLESAVTFVSGAEHSKAMLESGDPGLDTAAPFERSAKPALLLQLDPLFRSTWSWQRDSFDTEFFRLLLIVRREKSPVGCRHLGRLTELLRVFVERRHPLRLVSGIAICDVVVADDAVFHLVDADQSSKLRRLGCLPFADHRRMFLKDAHDLVGIVTLALENACPRLR